MPFYPELERKNQIDLKDAAGRPLIHLLGVGSGLFVE